MLTVEDYLRIRTAHREGLSVREIARQFHHSRRKIRQVLREAEPRPYTRAQAPPAPKLDPFKALIEQILAADEAAPPKQRHTAAKLYRRLRDEFGYPGGYDQVRRYVQGQGRRQRETFIPLCHEPGQRLEADFGHIYVDFPAGRQQVPVLLTTWSYSGYRFAIALPTERVEAILWGLVAALEFFDCLPRELWWDNPKTVATAILKGRQRTLHPRYAALASHYCLTPMFCMPRRGNEKPYVENSVFDLQRDWGTPVPRVQDYAELNAYLRECCRRKLTHRVNGQTETVGERFAREQAAAGALPGIAFDPCITTPAQVDKYQLVRFDNNRYSVPRRWAYELVTVKAYVHRVEIAAQGTIIASHLRSYGRNEQLIEPEHYLATLGRRPAALDHSGAFRSWNLPGSFAQLRQRLEARHGSSAGLRQYVRVLQLLAEHPAALVTQAIEWCLGRGLEQAEAVSNQLLRLSRQTPYPTPSILPEPYPQINVPLPDLRRFDQLLNPDDGDDHAEARRTVVEDEFEAAAPADHAGGVCPTGGGSGRAECRSPLLSAAAE